MPRARTGTVTLIQRSGGALNVWLHCHMLPLDGAYVECPDGALSFHRVGVPADRRASMTWAQRPKRVRGSGIERCSVCGGATRIVVRREDPEVIERILAHLDAKAAAGQASRLPPSRAPLARPCG